MKSRFFKNLCVACALLLAISVMSSCNRGVGCPSDFKAATNITLNILK